MKFISRRITLICLLIGTTTAQASHLSKSAQRGSSSKIAEESREKCKQITAPSIKKPFALNECNNLLMRIRDYIREFNSHIQVATSTESGVTLSLYYYNRFLLENPSYARATPAQKLELEEEESDHVQVITSDLAPLHFLYCYKKIIAVGGPYAHAIRSGRPAFRDEFNQLVLNEYAHLKEVDSKIK